MSYKEQKEKSEGKREASQGDGIQGKNTINIRFVVLGTKLPLL